MRKLNLSQREPIIYMSNQLTIISSFVHGYNDLDINLPEEERLALWVLEGETSKFYSYPFPRTTEDFAVMKDLIVGDLPDKNAMKFKKLPRFGLTGLAQTKDFIFAGAWNSVYKIDKEDYKLHSIISNQFMSDLHGIYVDEDIIITILTSKDTVIISNHEGAVIDYFEVDNKLEVTKDPKILEMDWRFVTKQFRGSTGYWHFNYVQKIGDEIWLTARNANAFVVVKLGEKRAKMRLMNLQTPVLLHDGRKVGNKFYFTSIDGKIIITEPHEGATIVQRDQLENMHLYNRDLVTTLIRLEDTSLGREPNWCRGIDVKEGIIYVSIDGRYDTDLSFGVLAIREADQKIVFNRRLKWAEVGDESDIRFVTGFDVLCTN